MGIAEDILARPVAERAAYKADLLQKRAAALTKKDGYGFVDGELTLTISQPELLKDGFQVTVEAERDGEKLPLEYIDNEGKVCSFNPFQFFDPRVAVWVDGKVAYDLTAAIEAMVADAVRVVTR